MATGGDQAGSIRIPASLSGVVGIKPTWGLVPYTGIMGMDPTIDHAGPLTATVAENALFLEVMAGADGYDSRQTGLKVDTYTKAIGQASHGMKIGVVKEGFGQYDFASRRRCRRARRGQEFRRLGAKVDEISIPWHPIGIPIWARNRSRGHLHAMFDERRPRPRTSKASIRCRSPARLGVAARPRQRAARHREGRHAARRPTRTNIIRAISTSRRRISAAACAPPTIARSASTTCCSCRRRG